MIFNFIFFIACLLIYNKNAFAYLDPGMGSILLQGIIATIAATGLTIKIYWQKIKDFFKQKIKNKNKNQK